MFHRPRRRVLHAALLCAAIFTFLGAGDESRFNDLGHRLMCVCSCNQILLECNHVGCNYSDRMRRELMTAIQHGDSDDLTLQAMVQNYGPTVIAAPTSTGFNRIAWIMPYFALIVGLTMMIAIVRAWRNRPLKASAASIPPISEAELERFRQQARKDTEL
jgi:cytochrome c-type biogenesis protein CcmH/NrfF